MINLRVVGGDLRPLKIDGLDLRLAIKYGVLPALYNDEAVLVLPNVRFGEALAYGVKLNLPLPFCKTSEQDYDKLLAKYQEEGREKGESLTSADAEDLIEDDLKLADFLRHSADLLSSEESAPVIKFVNSLFYQAIKKRASDIHIEAHEEYGEVRLRIDGALASYVKIEKNLLSPVISRVKIISHLDISERRIPQDGRTQVIVAGKTLDIRISIIPTYYGERVVMRLLSHASDAPTLASLGLKEEIVKELERLLAYSYGIILVTGPTGSGKSTTLHACMQKIADPGKNLISIEDPVEYKSANVSQIQVNDKVGLTFASGLRSILRQDPDVVMVGEIRDAETARIAVQAALTGHLTLSTLHTNDSISAIARLMDMGIENYLILSTVLGVLAQRLIRILCPHCKTESSLSAEYAQLLGLKEDLKVYQSASCDKCNHTGYVGRKAICELFSINSDVRTFLKDNATTHQIKDFMIKRGMRTLLDDVIELVISGETSPAEAVRVGVMEI